MKYTIQSPADLGLLLRAARKSAKVRLDDLSRTVEVSKQTTVNAEKGKSVQLSTILRLLNEVGLTLTVDLPDSALPALNKALLEAKERTSSTVNASGSTTPIAHRLLAKDDDRA
ncbi:hypothetical protein [Roseateles sp.]|uniref:hypothetical protein n=1 Tax=Roseateles sp. TaxID=1971397 RepID=UPI0039E7A6BB